MASKNVLKPCFFHLLATCAKKLLSNILPMRDVMYYGFYPLL